MEGEWQARRRSAAMADGASLIAPDTVWFAWDTKLGRDVTIEPNVFFGPGVTVADQVKIRANSHIEGATIGAGCEIGPFARLRPGTILGEQATIGNFGEKQQAVTGTGPYSVREGTGVSVRVDTGGGRNCKTRHMAI